ncbi:MAG TPA: amidohydrolase family protein [Gemmataceae bacterium]|nr:amidohydrolase family protein [Gemmataceae bacterium]
MNRRSFLQLSVAGMASLGLPQLLQAREASTEKFALSKDTSAGAGSIDSHVHIWTRDSKYPFAPEVTDKPRDEALPATLLTLMRANGVAKTVLVQMIYYRWDNNYVAEVMAKHRGTFMAVGRVNPTDTHATDNLEYWTRHRGLYGVRLSPGNGPSGDWINRRDLMDPIWKRATALAVPMCILCPAQRLPDVSRVIERFVDLDVCIDHMADCPIGDKENLAKLLALRRFPRVYVKISHLWSLSRQAYPYRDTHEQVRKIYDAFGAGRLMWGSDWPLVERYCPYARVVQLYREEMKFLSDADRQWILHKTAAKLWPFV